MLFITNRVLVQGSQSAQRPVDFELRDANALQSLFFCERAGEGAYVEIESPAFLQRLKDSAAEQVLVYIHGFNNLPEDAAFQRALALQRHFDARRPDLVEVVALVWPCVRTDGAGEFINGYYSDQAAADASAVAYGRALAKLLAWQQANLENDVPCLKRLNVLAHSMGARVLRGAVKWWCEEILGSEPPVLFRNAFLVAADVENETLERDHEGGTIPSASRNVVVYHTYEDLAMRASKAAGVRSRNVGRRLGHTGPYDMAKVPANVYAVDCDAVAQAYDPLKGHTYFIDEQTGQPGRVFDHIFDCVATARPAADDFNRHRIG